MNDHQHIVDQIRMFLAGADQTRSPELADLAQAYASLCREANDRLRRSTDYLRRGLRSEAIHLAEQPPVLLDVVAALDFPEAADWETLCATYELARPPRLLIESAAELNEAYAADQPLRVLLARHRRLALCRAPLPQRLAVMRELAAQDPQSVFWDEDIGTFESARIKEMYAEAGSAVRARDLAWLARLQEEATSDDWRVEPSAELKKGIEAALTAHRHERAGAELRAMLPAIEEAYLALDYEACQQLLTTMRRTCSDAGMAMPPDVVDAVQAARDWTEQQRDQRERAMHFEQACAQLSEAVANGVPADELERQRRMAAAWGFELPTELSTAIHRERVRQEQARIRRLRRNIGVAVACAAVMILAVALIVRHQAAERQAKSLHDQLDAMIMAGRLDEAQTFWSQLAANHPRVAQRSEVKSLKHFLDSRAAEEAGRRAAFRAHAAAVLADGPERPNLKELEAASRKAKTAEEKREVVQLKEKIEAARVAALRKLEEEFRAATAALEAEIDRLALAARGGGLAPGDRQLDAAEAKAIELAGRSEVPEDLRRPLPAIRDRVIGIRHALDMSAAERKALERVRQAAPTVQALKTALEQYVAEDASRPRAAAFKAAASYASRWQSVEAWASLAQSWGNGLEPRASDIAGRLEAVKQHVAGYTDSALLPQIQSYLDYLVRAQKAQADNGTWKGDLKAMLNNPLIRDLNCIRTVQGRLYYLPPGGKLKIARIGEKAVTYTFDAIFSADLSQTREVTLRAEQVVGEPGPSPQAVLNRQLQEQLNGVGPGNWETFGLEVIRTMHGCADADPLLKLILICHAIRLSEEAGWGLGDSLGKYASSLDAVNANDLQWMSPDDPAATEARPRAQEALAKVPDLKKVHAAAIARRDALMQSLDLRLAGRGILLKEDGRRTVLTAAKLESGQLLYAVVASDSQLLLGPVGRVKDDKAELNEAAAQSVPEGSMIFICREPAK